MRKIFFVSGLWILGCLPTCFDEALAQEGPRDISLCRLAPWVEPDGDGSQQKVYRLVPRFYQQVKNESPPEFMVLLTHGRRGFGISIVPCNVGTKQINIANLDYNRANLLLGKPAVGRLGENIFQLKTTESKRRFFYFDAVFGTDGTIERYRVRQDVVPTSPWRSL